MPPENDGVVEIPVPGGPASDVVQHGNDEDSVMDPEVAKHLMTETVGNIQANNRDGRNTATIAQGVLQAAAARNFDELGAVESRSTSGVMATPVASPTTQAS